MDNLKSDKPATKGPVFKRKAVSLAQEEWVKARPLFPGERLPLLVEPAVEGIDLVTWAKENQRYVEDNILQHGAILFRNFNVKTAPDFERFIGVVSSGAAEYSRRAGPRTRVSGNIYTSTDYPADQNIFPHNEGAFQPVFPLRVFFYCVKPAQEGGETPIGDCRKITAAIPPEIKNRFVEKGVMYQRNFGSGFGLSWETVFQTADKAEIEDYCRKENIQFEWYPSPMKDAECLRTRVVGPAMVRHPRTGELVWFNHGTFFHVSTLPPVIRDGLLEQFQERDLPNHTYYGDGTPIEPEVVAELREIYQKAMVEFPWQQGDIVAVDNIFAVHARRPFKGERMVVVGMADHTHWKDVQID